MKAVTISKYGTPDNFQFQEIEKPIPNDDQILIKLKAVSINASDMESLRGKPGYVRLFGGFFAPKTKILGSDVAGVVEAVGNNVSNFKPGDAVFGDIFWKGSGGFAEYCLATEKDIIHKPEGMSFEQAAALPQAGVIALQAFRDYKQVEPGHKVLINGAGGGAGSFALQFAKMHDVEVTAVDRAEKFELMTALGAKHIIDYRKTNYTKTGQKYDYIIDLIAHRSYWAYRRALKSNGEFVMVGGNSNALIQAALLGPQLSRFDDRQVDLLMWRPNTDDLQTLCKLFSEHKVVPIIDRCFSLQQVPDAFWYIAEGTFKGKVIISIDE